MLSFILSAADKVMKCCGCPKYACVDINSASVLFLAGQGSMSPVTRVVVGVHPEVEKKYAREGKHSIIGSRRYFFCSDCSAGLFDRIVDAVTKVRPDQTANFLSSAKPSECELDFAKGHWLTYTEYFYLGIGRFFSLQFSRESFKEMIKWLPAVFDGLAYEMRDSK